MCVRNNGEKMIDKLEVGKKYVDKIGTVYIVVSYDSEKDLYIARHAGIKTYPEYYGYHGDGKLFDGVDNSAFDLIKEYTEPKTVSGYAVVSVDEDDNMKIEEV